MVHEAKSHVILQFNVILRLLGRVQGAVRASPPWVQSNLTRLVSHHPLRDISVVTWFAFLLGCRQFGEKADMGC